MKILFLLTIISSASLFAQVPIQYYDFEDNDNRAGILELTTEIIINAVSGSIAANNGSGSLTRGTGNPSSGSAASRASWPVAAGNPGVSTADYISFNANTSGFEDIFVSLEAISSSANLDNLVLLYSTDNSTFVSAGAKTINLSYSTVEWDLSSIAALNDVSALYFRLYPYSTVATTGIEALTIDNLAISAAAIIASKTLGDYSLIEEATTSYPVFSNFTVKGIGIDAALSDNLILNGTLTLTNGIISTGSNYVRINDGGSISGGSSASYINGNLSWYFPTNAIGETRFFHVGTAANYRRIDVTLTAITSSGFVDAKVTDSPPSSTSLPAGVNNISSVRFWSVNFSGDIAFAPEALIGPKLFFDNDDGVTNISDLTVVRGTNGGAWTAESATGNSGTTPSGWILGSFGSPANSDFTLGNKGDNPLPVELSSFTAKLLNNSVLLEWQTETEVDNYGFEIQRAELRNQKLDWESIGFVNGHGNSNSVKEYSFTDNLDLDLNLDHDLNLTLYYRLKQIDNDGTFEYSDIVEVVINNRPTEFSLEQNYPNPFNPATKIKFRIADLGFVNLKIYDVLGNEVAALVNEEKEPGVYEVEWNASNMASGVYYYTLKAGSFTQTKKMMLAK